MSKPSTRFIYQSTVPSISEEIHTSAEIIEKVPKLLNWPTVQDDALSPISGGITNKMFKLTHPSNTSTAVVIRLYGGADVFTPEQRAVENIIFEQLSNAGISPRLLGKFGNGRVEQFLNARPIHLKEMTTPCVCDGVAIALARLHTFQPTISPLHSPSSTLETNPLPSEEIQPTVWNNLHSWAEEVQQQMTTAYNDTGHPQTNGKKKDLFEGIDIDKCISALKVIELKTGSDDVVFAHNDLLAGNILLCEGNSQKITLIDYEYGDYNYRAYDIGNFFAEAMGGTEDGTVRPELYPSLKFRRRFCSVYLKSYYGYQPCKEQEDELVDKAERFGLLSHLYWGFWALVQSKQSIVDFPYVKFAKQRFDQFFEKSEQVGNLKHLLNFNERRI